MRNSALVRVLKLEVLLVHRGPGSQAPNLRFMRGEESRRKDAILDKGGKALSGIGVVGAVVVGVIKKLPKKL